MTSNFSDRAESSFGHITQMLRDQVGTIAIHSVAGIFYSTSSPQTRERKKERESLKIPGNFWVIAIRPLRYNALPRGRSWRTHGAKEFTDRPIKRRRYFRHHVDGTCDKPVTRDQWVTEFFETSLNPARVSNVPLPRASIPVHLRAHAIIFNIADTDSDCGVSAFYLILAPDRRDLI